MIDVQKKELREKMYELRNNVALEDHKQASDIICNQLIEVVKEKSAKTVHCFIPMGNEVDVRPFIEYCLAQSIVVVCPKTLKKTQLKHLVLSNLLDVEKGVYGTVFPAGDNEFNGDLDLIVVPGLAYDKQGGRLGYGGGYYDTFLGNELKAIKVGVGFSCQVVEKVPMEKHDVQLDILYTS